MTKENKKYNSIIIGKHLDRIIELLDNYKFDEETLDSVTKILRDTRLEMEKYLSNLEKNQKV